jgi:hypothetical protein
VRSGIEIITKVAVQQALAADRFAHEIVGILPRGFGLHLISTYDCGG